MDINLQKLNEKNYSANTPENCKTHWFKQYASEFVTLFWKKYLSLGILSLC